MPTCSDSTATSTPTVELDGLRRWLEGQFGSGLGHSSSLEAFESALQDQLAAVGRAAVQAYLESLDSDAPNVIIDGEDYRRSIRCSATYHTAFGRLPVERTLYRRASGGRGDLSVAPMDLRAGVVATRWTPIAAKQASFLLAHCTAAEAHQAIALFRPHGASKSTLHRLSTQLGTEWEEQRVPIMEEVRALEAVPENATTVSVALDGIMGMTRDVCRAQAKVAARARGKGGGPAGFREFSCGTVTFHDAKGDRIVTRYIGRAPEARKLTLRHELQAELRSVLAQRPDLTVCKLSDGANDHWRFLSDELDCDGVETLDFFHAAENLAHALRSAYGDGTARFQERFATLRHRLLEQDDGVVRVIRSLARLQKRFPRKRLIIKHLKYFRNHRHRMDYARLARRGLPIGSGVVEAACKTLVTARLKRTGMRWTIQGAQAVLTFRALAKSGRFDRAWTVFLWKRRRTVSESPDLRLVA